MSRKVFYKIYKKVIGQSDLKLKRDAPARKYLGEAALSLRSRRSGTKRTALFGLFAKCRRLPRGFLWNTSLPPLVVGCSTLGKANVMV